MWVVGARIGVAAPLGATQPGGVHPPERGSFREYWPLREHVCQPQLTGRRKNFVVDSFGSPEPSRTFDPVVNSPAAHAAVGDALLKLVLRVFDTVPLSVH